MVYTFLLDIWLKMVSKFRKLILAHCKIVTLQLRSEVTQGPMGETPVIIAGRRESAICHTMIERVAPYKSTVLISGESARAKSCSPRHSPGHNARGQAVRRGSTAARFRKI
jgi:hypothetical protein